MPYVPDLISDTNADVCAVVESFSVLQPTDRRLLVPMPAVRADLPLAKAHEAATRATLQHALQTVHTDEHVPTVARALLRCARAPDPVSAAVIALHNTFSDATSTLSLYKPRVNFESTSRTTIS